MPEPARKADVVATGLAACAAANPPPDVEVVTFFISRTTGAQTVQFLRDPLGAGAVPVVGQRVIPVCPSE